MDRITKEIYIGGQTSPEDIKLHKIKSVINLSSIPTEYSSESLPINDSGENDPAKLIEILKAIDSKIKKGETPVYVSCLAGMSRSVVIVALYLVYKKKSSSLEDAIDLVRSRHPQAMPSLELLDFAKTKVIPLF